MKAFLQIFGILMSLVFLLEAVLAVDFPEAKVSHLNSLHEYSSDSGLTSDAHSGSFSQAKSKGAGSTGSGSGNGETPGYGASGSGTGAGYGDSNGSSRGASGSSNGKNH